VTRAIEIAQKRVETHNFEIRKQLLEYDNVMNKQREVIYELRRSILEGENLKDVVLDSVASSADEAVGAHFAVATDTGPALDALSADLLAKFNLDIAPVKEDLKEANIQKVKDGIIDMLMKAYEVKEGQLTPEIMRRMERMVLLHVIDNKWKDHLHAMDHIKDGISLRALGQRDPLVEYKKEGFAMFKAMYAAINQDVATLMFKMEPPPEAARPRSVFSTIDQKAIHQEFSGLPVPQPGKGEESSSPSPVPQAIPARYDNKVGRNDPCPCGSGKKYKKCCGQ
jgi:preprotein translocase subunit SecA